MQRALVRKFPSVSVIDLALVLNTVNAILDKVSFVIRFMASFTIVTGIIVLIASVLTGRYQRMQESILLRTLGASKKQISSILLIEYLLLGFLAALTGVILAEGGAWALARHLFKIEYHPAILPALLTMGIVTALTILTGLAANRGILKTPPLEILRSSG
jgi:putative ABC transport system permease protein